MTREQFLKNTCGVIKKLCSTLSFTTEELDAHIKEIYSNPKLFILFWQL